jgi:predicted transcriptional regulator
MIFKQYSYRDRIDIIESILDIANGNEVRQGEILHKANITYTKFKECLSIMLQYGLIQYVLRQESYKTTAKGLDFLHVYNKMKSLLLSPPLDLSSESSIPTINKIPTFLSIFNK